jgi:glycosyltransferase involved in cell wall biosynthesis
VTFVVPCHNLAHLLPDCLRSILCQTFTDFEILVMDDCSPDDTPEVVRSFDDPRVHHIRHAANVGHLENYNAGIRHARGKYLWLISADDRLRRDYVLARFVAAMEAHPRATFVFCPVIKLKGAEETVQSGWSAPNDCVLDGKRFLGDLLGVNCVPAASAMARTDAYRSAGGFPLDLPYSGDWYMWCVFALRGDVIALAEPMVNYRLHDGNMTHDFVRNPPAKMRDEIAVRWRTLRLAEACGAKRVVASARSAISTDYAFRLTGRFPDGTACRQTPSQIEASLAEHTRSRVERLRIRSATYAQLGDCLQLQDVEAATAAYRAALRSNPAALTTWLKLAVLAAGPAGFRLRCRVHRWVHRPARAAKAPAPPQLT